jgi:hypothetical protein
MTDPDYAAKLAALDAGTLPPEAFRHRDHLGVAYEALRQDDFPAAWQRIERGIRALARRAGVPHKYNATITFAYLSAIAERMARRPHGDAKAFLAAHPELLDADFLALRYGRERMGSELARRIPLLPEPGAPPAP